MAESTALKTFQFELVSPEKVLSSEPVTMVTIPGEDGDFGVLYGHAPLLSSLRPGVVTVQSEKGTTRIFVSDGFADVSGTICSVLAENAVNLEDLSVESVNKEIANLSDDLSMAGDDAQKKARLESQILISRAKLLALGVRA